MRWGIAGLMLALMTASALAQSPGTSSSTNIGQHAEAAAQRGAAAADAQKIKANDNAYRAALKNLPDKQYDPWHGMR